MRLPAGKHRIVIDARGWQLAFVVCDATEPQQRINGNDFSLLRKDAVGEILSVLLAQRKRRVRVARYGLLSALQQCNFALARFGGTR